MEELADGVFVETRYEAVNVAAILTDEGFVCIDVPSYPRNARDWVAQLQQISSRPFLFLILTDNHGDRILNSRWFNAPIITHAWTAEKLGEYEKRYPPTLLDNLVARNPYRGRELSATSVEQATLSFTDHLLLLKGSQSITLRHEPGPTPGSLWVELPAHQLLFAGDHVVVDTPPLLAEADTSRWLASLNKLRASQDKLQCLIPGRGPLHERNPISSMVDYLQRLRELVGAHIARGGSREGTAAYAPDLAALFPEERGAPDWIHSQIKGALARVYDELTQPEPEQNVSAEAAETSEA